MTSPVIQPCGTEVVTVAVLPARIRVVTERTVTGSADFEISSAGPTTCGFTSFERKKGVWTLS